jgi:predicted transcriptional regulator
MKTTTTNNHSMTLRLEPKVAEAVENTAYELRMSQASFIRRAIRRSLEHAQVHELPIVRSRQVKAALMP